MKKTPKSTMRDLAAQLGISHSTVSRALRDDPRIGVAPTHHLEESLS